MDLTEVPSEFRDQFLKLVNELEKKTGKTYILSLCELGKCEIELNDPSLRGPYEIYEMSENLSELNGIYQNSKEIEMKIHTLTAKDFIVFEDTGKFFWNCSKCGNKVPFVQLCPICLKFRKSKWNGVEVGYRGGHIYQSFDGFGTIVGKINILK